MAKHGLGFKRSIMSMNQVEEEIRHLDFELPEEEPKKEDQINHWVHPTDPDKHWCGHPRSNRKYTGAKACGPSEINCVGCLQQALTNGFDWWWKLHCLFFHSTCDVGKHNCGF